MSARELITGHLDLWTGAVTKKSRSGRGSNSKVALTGIKKLRELILELAVRGKLVEQDSEDEPAGELLLKVFENNETPPSKKTKAAGYPETAEGAASYTTPKAWAWAQVGDLFNIVYGKGLAKSKLTDEGYEVFGANGIIGKYTEYTYEHPQLLISCRGAYSGKANISPTRCFITSNTLILRNTWRHLNLQYFYYALTVADKSKIVTGSAQPQVTTTNLSPFLIAVPPLKEQHRIVQKVDELMALCDRLEQQTSDQLEAHETLLGTLLDTLTQSENATELADNWARLAAHFDTLFTTEQSIDKLKQTILQLAVMGRLTYQDPSEEPTSVLLEKIADEMCQLTANKRTKKGRALPPISDEELPFEKPLGWEAARLHSLIAISSGDGLTAAEMNNDGGIPVFGGNGVNGFHDKANVRESTLVIGRVGYYCGSIHITPEKAWVTDNAFITRFARKHLSQRYLYWLLKATNLKEQDNATAQPVISGRKIYPIVVIIAPRLEQDRISEKIDELMALCDHLKERLSQASETRGQLAETVVENALH